jgi:hypothetical protein
MFSDYTCVVRQVWDGVEIPIIQGTQVEHHYKMDQNVILVI